MSGTPLECAQSPRFTASGGLQPLDNVVLPLADRLMNIEL